jgi:hypothetical protein
LLSSEFYEKAHLLVCAEDINGMTQCES